MSFIGVISDTHGLVRTEAVEALRGAALILHTVAETKADMRALLQGASAAGEQPLSFLLPTRQAELFRWLLSKGMRVVKSMNLMTTGE